MATLVRMLVGKGKAGMVAEVLAEFAAILGSARGGRHLGVCAGHGCSSAPVGGGARYAAAGRGACWRRRRRCGDGATTSRLELSTNTKGASTPFVDDMR